MDLPPYITDQLTLIEQAQSALDAEKLKRARIEMSDEYIMLNKQIDGFNAQKALLVENLQDSQMEAKLQGLKTGLFAVMEREGREKVGRYQGKYKENRGVNTEKLLTVLGGDLDRFLRMSKVTQIDLKAFAREEGGGREEQLLNCIEVTERKLIDLIPIEAQR